MNLLVILIEIYRLVVFWKKNLSIDAGLQVGGGDLSWVGIGFSRGGFVFGIG